MWTSLRRHRRTYFYALQVHVNTEIGQDFNIYVAHLQGIICLHHYRNALSLTSGFQRTQGNLFATVS